MIDRKTALACAALVALMLVAAVWRILTLDGWTILGVQNETPQSSLLLFVFPAASALVVGALYWDRVEQQQTTQSSSLGANGESSSRSAIVAACCCCKVC